MSISDYSSFARISKLRQGGESALSSAHISPFCEWRAGARYLKVCKGGEGQKVGGGKRGVISGFSRGSRRRLMFLIESIRVDKLPLFVTLTYPYKFPSPAEAKVHLDTFFKRLVRAFPSAGAVWKLEPQKRGAPHFHVLIWGCNEPDLKTWIPEAWFDIAGGGDRRHLVWHMGGFGNENCVQQVHTRRGVTCYASKYLGKTFEVAGWGEKWVGRFWGVIQRERIPWGEFQVAALTLRMAVQVMRYQRRFARMKARSSRSLTVFCDADQWVEKLSIRGSCQGSPVFGDLRSP